MNIRVGYFVPEFPGQTHAFLWRERQFLQAAGVETDIISTKQPPQAIKSQVWAQVAESMTTYLLPLAPADFLHMALALFQAGPLGWLRCLQAIVQAKGVSLSQRLRLLMIAVISAKLVRLSKDRGWSHIHVHSCAESAHIAMFASKLSGLTYSLSLLGPTLEQYGPNQEFKWKNAAFGLAISKLLYQHVRTVLANYLPPRFDYAVMAVDTEASQRLKPYEPWRGDRAFTIFSCGRLNPVKGHKYLIEAVGLLKAQGYPVHLQIGGEDEKGGTGYRQEIERLIQDQGLAEQVEVLGAISEDQFRYHLQQVDLFAMGSLNEGISVAAMEAMSMEVPVVMTRVGGMHELIDSGVNGILVEPERADQLADAIAQIMQNPQLAMKLSANARQKVVEQFDSRLGAKVLADNLKLVMSQKATQTPLQGDSEVRSSDRWVNSLDP